MALKAALTAEEFAKIPDPFKAEYKETKAGSGKYVLDVTPTDGFALEDVAGLKSALGKERSDKEALERAAKAYEGIDVAKAREAMAQLEEIKKNPLDERVRAQVEAREKALTEKFGKDLAAKDAEASDYRKQLEEQLVESAVVAALAKHKGNAALLSPHVTKQIRVEKDARGKYVARVIDPATGTPRISLKSGSSANMDIDELVETMKASDVFGVAFEGSKASGTGAASGGGSGAGGGKTVSVRDQKALDANIEKIASGEVTVVE